MSGNTGVRLIRRDDLENSLLTRNMFQSQIVICNRCYCSFFDIEVFHCHRCHSCQICGDSLGLISIEHHNANRRFVCTYCELHFEDEADLTTHEANECQNIAPNQQNFH